MRSESPAGASPLLVGAISRSLRLDIRRVPSGRDVHPFFLEIRTHKGKPFHLGKPLYQGRPTSSPAGCLAAVLPTYSLSRADPNRKAFPSTKAIITAASRPTPQP